MLGCDLCVNSTQTGDNVESCPSVTMALEWDVIPFFLKFHQMET